VIYFTLIENVLCLWKGGYLDMECKVCGIRTEKSILCADCEKKINTLSSEMTSSKKKINMQFEEHRFFTRDKCAN
jgi:uncharacterized Zn finger protein (UPF0148 family)